MGGRTQDRAIHKHAYMHHRHNGSTGRAPALWPEDCGVDPLPSHINHIKNSLRCSFFFKSEVHCKTKIKKNIHQETMLTFTV